MRIQKSIRFKLIVTMTVTTAFLLASEGMISLSVSQKSFKSTLNAKYQVTNALVSSEINGKVLEDVGFVDSIISFVDSEPSMEDAETSEGFVQLLENITNNTESITDAYVGFPDKVFVNGEGWTPPSDYDCTSRNWYTNAKSANGDLVFSEPYVDASSGETVVTISKYFSTGTFNGVAGVDIKMSTFVNFITDQIAERGSDGDYIIITSEAGNILYHPNEEFNMSGDSVINIDSVLDGSYLTAVEKGTSFEDYDGTSCNVTNESCEDSKWVVYYVTPSKYFNEQVKKNRDSLFSIFVVNVFIALFIATFMGYKIAKPIKLATADADEMSRALKAGEADLTKHLVTKSQDEIGMLVHSINRIIDALHSIIEETQNTTDGITTSSNEIDIQVKKADDELSNISATMQEISALSEEQSASISDITLQVEQMSKLTDIVMEDCTEKTQKANEAATNVKHLQEESQAAEAEGARVLNDVADNLKVKIEHAETVNEIANLTNEILNITSQTNLLALNASIEAARAGEAGKGFAVVADEIRQLADNSREATTRIQQVTDAVILAVDDLAAEAKRVTDFMLETNTKSRENVEKLTDEYSGIIGELAESMNDFKANSEQIKDALSIVSASIEAVTQASEENTRGISDVTEATTELSGGLQEIVNKTNDNSENVSGLNQRMRNFKI